MNILHLIENLEFGGAQIRLINDLKFIDRKKFNNIVCSLNGGGGLLKEITNLEIKTYTLNGPLNLKSIFKLIKIIKQNHIDIIHTQLFFADILGRLIGRLCKVNAITSTIQAVVYEPGLFGMYSFKRKILDKYTGQFFIKKFIAVSKHVKHSSMMRLDIGEDKIEIIYNSFDPGKFTTDNDIEEIINCKKNLEIKDSDIVLISIGRLVSAKGHEYILRAMPGIKNRISNIVLLVIGEGPEEGKLKSITESLGLTDIVRFMGIRQDIGQLLMLSDIFIFPTSIQCEGLPVALIEAMASKKLCIGANVAPIDEVIEDEKTGLLFEKGSYDNLSAMVLKGIELLKGRTEICERGHKFVMEKFNAKKEVIKLEKFYENLLN